MIFPVPLEDLTAEHLETLLGRVESQELEFKRDPYGRGEEDIREMLRDITAIANAAGGYIIIGIEADGEGGADRFVTVPNAEDEVLRMTQSCLANIDERILGLKIRTVIVDANTSSLLVFIPRSTRAPHMVTFRGLNQFWKRYGTIKNKMSVEEIKEASIKTVNLRKSLEEFLEERKSKILSKIGSTLILPRNSGHLEKGGACSPRRWSTWGEHDACLLGSLSKRP